MSIVVENVSFSYGKKNPFGSMVLDRVNLKIESGEYLIIIGEVGSGKTTLIKHFNGLLKPLEGIVMVDGHKATSAHARKLVGMLFQYPQYQFFGKTVFDDVAFSVSNSGIDDKQLHEKVIESLKMVGLDENIALRSPFTLSNGQMKLAALASILAANPKYIILDEPFTGLDLINKKKLFKALAKLHDIGITIIIATHEIYYELPINSRTILMGMGKIIFEGNLEEYALSKHSQLSDVTLLMRELRRRGVDISENIFDVETAFEEIMNIKKVSIEHE